MPGKQLIILAHGGAGSDNAHSDGTDRACQTRPGADAGPNSRSGSGLPGGEPSWKTIPASTPARDRANARDGSVRMDAACMDSRHRFGAVSAIQHIKNPIHVARHVADSEYRLLTGEDAHQYAVELGFKKVDMTRMESNAPGTDTVGAVVFDGTQFAAALSTGGTGGSRPGRVGDVPLIGCGLYAGEHGAVCATGHGESITLNLTAYRTYEMLGRASHRKRHWIPRSLV